MYQGPDPIAVVLLSSLSPLSPLFPLEEGHLVQVSTILF
jgi:hypothetical protein